MPHPLPAPLPIVRLAAADDVPELVRVINLAYRVEDFFVNGDRTNEREVRARMAQSNGSYLVVDGPSGSLAASVHLEIDGDRGHFSVLSVDPAHQKQGLARLLIAAIEDRCRAAGCRFVDIEIVNLRRELPAFYHQFGFVPDGTTAPFPDPHKLTRDAHLIRMSKEL